MVPSLIVPFMIVVPRDFKQKTTNARARQYVDVLDLVLYGKDETTMGTDHCKAWDLS